MDRQTQETLIGTGIPSEELVKIWRDMGFCAAIPQLKHRDVDPLDAAIPRPTDTAPAQLTQ